MEQKIKKEIKNFLMSMTYDEMSDDILSLVVEYETEQIKPKIDKMKEKGLSISKIEDKIHDLWLDYRIADGTEDNLIAYVNS